MFTFLNRKYCGLFTSTFIHIEVVFSGFLFRELIQGFWGAMAVCYCKKKKIVFFQYLLSETSGPNQFISIQIDQSSFKTTEINWQSNLYSRFCEFYLKNMLYFSILERSLSISWNLGDCFSENNFSEIIFWKNNVLHFMSAF